MRKGFEGPRFPLRRSHQGAGIPRYGKGWLCRMSCRSITSMGDTLKARCGIEDRPIKCRTDGRFEAFDFGEIPLRQGGVVGAPNPKNRVGKLQNRE